MKQRNVQQNLLLACSLLVVFMVTGCTSGPTIRSNMDESVDFHRFRTFGFFDPLATDREGYQTLVSQQLVSSAERELVARGLTRTDNNPDLLINFRVNLDLMAMALQTENLTMSGEKASGGIQAPVEA